MDERKVAITNLNVPWSRYKLNELIDVKHGFAYQGEYWSQVETRRVLVTPINFKMGGGFNSKKLKYYCEDAPCPDGYILSTNDLILTMTDLSKDGGTLGYPAIVPDSEKVFLHNQRIGKVIFLTNTIDKKYLFYAFCHKKYRDYILATASGTTVNHTSPQRITDFYIELPTMIEQQKIADILSTVDKQIDQTDALIEKSRDLKKGLTQRLFTKGIGHTEFQDTEIGWIPKGWEVVRLGEVVDIVNGATPSTKIDQYWTNGTVPWATPSDITSNGKYISGTYKRISENGLKDSSATLLPPGSILMTSRATIGEKCINTIPMATNQGFKSMICSDRIHNEFLYYSLDMAKAAFVKLASGSTFLEISTKEVIAFKIKLPKKQEQIMIAAILSQTDREIELLTEKKRYLQKEKSALMQKLLTGEIRVSFS